MFGHLFSWLGSTLSLWPAIGVAVAGLAWVGSIIAADHDDDFAGLAVMGAIGVIVSFFASFSNASISQGLWAYWLPFLAGVAIIPACYGAACAIDAFDEWKKRHDAEVKAEQKRIQQEARRRAEEKAKSPAGVIARCEAIVKKYIDALPQDLLVIEERRQAETKMDALRALYKLVETIAKLGPDDEESFEEHLTEADALFADVSLEKECGALVKELRERSVKKAPPILKIHAAIEALVLSIESLPGKAAARIAEQVPTEYLVSSEDMTAEMGRPVLPVIDLTPEPEEQTKTPSPRARRQLA